MPEQADVWAAGQRRPLNLPGPAGQIEALLETPDEPVPARAVMLVCHPHPQYGGAMTNKVAHTLARAALAEGVAALRFNFRGVGDSEGTFADGVGETEDALALYNWLRDQQPGMPVILAGFSFGAAVALRLAARVESALLVTIAPPLRYFDGEEMPVPRSPWWVAHGDADDVVDCADTLKRIESAGLNPEHHVLAGAGHFFHGRLAELREQVRSALRERL